MKVMKSKIFLAIFLTFLLLPFSILASTRFDYLTQGADGVQYVYGTNWGGQTFTASDNYYLTEFYIYATIVGSPATATISLRATTDGMPSGADLCSGTADTTGWTTAWHSFSLTSCPELANGTQYALILRALTGDVNNKIQMKLRSDNPYAGGQDIYSSNSGTDWLADTDWDFPFETWGTQETPTATAESINFSDIYEKVEASGDTTAIFYINKSLSYGDIITFIFYTIFIIWGIIVGLWKFVFPFSFKR